MFTFLFTFLFTFFVYLESGGRFEFELKFGFEIEFEFELKGTDEKLQHSTVWLCNV